VYYVTGLGLSLLFVTSMSSVHSYFDGKSRSVALAVVTTSGGVGSVAIPYILRLSILTYGWRGALLIMSALMLQNLVTALIFKSTARKAVEQSGKQHLVSLLCTLLKNTNYMLASLGICVAIGSLQTPLTFMVDLASSKGFEIDTGVYCLLLQGVGSIIGRIAPAILIPHVSHLAIPPACAFLGGVSVVCLPIANHKWMLYVVVTAFGVSLGGVLSMMTIVASELADSDVFSLALGTTFTLCGVSTIVASPVSGTY
jgi:predicted MFS family arabinose efflux permease